MNIVFAGTPEFARVALAAILNAAPMHGFKVSLVLTQPDRPAGRGLKLQASPVKQLADERGLLLAQPVKLKELSEDIAALIARADIMVVAAYGLILPQRVLDMPRLGCINIHASLLPRWRGAAPIHRAIEAGDKETGVCIMQMDVGLDTGGVLLQEALAIDAQDTTATLHDKLATLGARLCVQALTNIERLPPTAQPSLPNSGVTYAQKIDKAESPLDWTQSAEQLSRKIRAFDPFPGCTTRTGGETLKIWAALPIDTKLNPNATPGQVLEVNDQGIHVACGEGTLCLTQLQRAGGKRLASAEFCKGFALQVGAAFER